MEKTEKLVLTQKMISTSKQCAEHPFSSQNTQKTLFNIGTRKVFRNKIFVFFVFVWSQRKGAPIRTSNKAVFGIFKIPKTVTVTVI